MTNKERQPLPELDGAVLRAFAATFIQRLDRYSKQRPDGGYTALREPLTMQLIEAHIRGFVTLGAYALNEQSRGTWLCLDADDGQEADRLAYMVEDLTGQGIPTYREQSRRGCHLWLFTDPLSGTDLRRIGKWLKEVYQLGEMELYPRQDRLATEPGSLVRLPLGIHRRADPPKRFLFVTSDGQLLAPTVREQMKLLSTPKRVPKTWITDVLACVPLPKEALPTPQFKKINMGDARQLSEKLKAAISVKDFVGRFVDLDRGNVGLCPFHDDHEVSFSVNEQGNYWYCFACRRGQTIIDFWMLWRQLHGQDGSFTASLSELRHILL